MLVFKGEDERLQGSRPASAGARTLPLRAQGQGAWATMSTNSLVQIWNLAAPWTILAPAIARLTQGAR